MIEPQAGIQRDAVADGERITDKQRRRDERPPAIDGARRLGLKWRAAAVDVLNASREDGRRAMLAALDLRADLELDDPRPASSDRTD